jgi:diguanylate cyclase
MNVKITSPVVDPIRVLVVDDEPDVLSSYREILKSAGDRLPNRRLEDLRSRLFNNLKPAASPAEAQDVFELEMCSSAEEAVRSISASIEQSKPFSVAFLDMRMPPGHDGVWAASNIRKLDKRLDIVIVTAYSDIDPEEIARTVPPRGSLFYLQKPFHPHEIRQLAVALGRRRQYQERIHKIAYSDEVTGLPNRAFFKEYLRHGLEMARLGTHHLALLFLDLDNFKRINDTLGHPTGDILLNEVAKRLQMNLRASDELAIGIPDGGEKNLARMGGDEFTIVLIKIASDDDARLVADRLLSVLSNPIYIGGNEVFVTASIGLAVFPRDGEDIEALIKHADMAMYFAKQDGKNRYKFYSETMNAETLRRLAVENELRRAMEREELKVYYQPQMNVLTGFISGMEALLRWDNAILGQISPVEFIPIAEDIGLIVPIGEWVLKAACIQAKAWHDSGIGLPRIAVNVSVNQLRQGNFPELVGRILAETGLEPEALELEITESVVMDRGEESINILRELKKTGISLAIDDFGTGYSNLGYLKRFPIDRLKIDRSFISSIQTDPQSLVITKSVIAIAESMKLSVTAEGVETEEQMALLRTERCNEIQGFYLNPPMSKKDAEEFLRAIPITTLKDSSYRAELYQPEAR